jgi:hypothetical protein
MSAAPHTQSKFSPRPVAAPFSPAPTTPTPVVSTAAATTTVNSSSIAHARAPRALRSTTSAIPPRIKHAPKLASVVMAPSREVIHEFDPAAARASSTLDQALTIGGLGAVLDGDGVFLTFECVQGIRVDSFSCSWHPAIRGVCCRAGQFGSPIVARGDQGCQRRCQWPHVFARPMIPKPVSLWFVFPLLLIIIILVIIITI